MLDGHMTILIFRGEKVCQLGRIIQPSPLNIVFQGGITKSAQFVYWAKKGIEQPGYRPKEITLEFQDLLGHSVASINLEKAIISDWQAVEFVDKLIPEWEIKSLSLTFRKITWTIPNR